MTTRTIVAVSAGMREPSSTRLLTDRLVEAVVSGLSEAGVPAQSTVIELRPLAHPIADALLTGFAPAALAEAHQALAGADGVIVVSPVFNASYSGLFKSFLDTLEAGTLAGVPTLIGATSGTPRHSLVLDHALRPLMSYLKATVMPTGVMAATEDWGGDAAALQQRIARAGSELAQAVAQAAPRVPVDPFDQAIASFGTIEDLLRGQ